MQTKKRPQRPVVGLIGPTNLLRISQASGIAEDYYRDSAYQAGQIIARLGAVLTVVPDRGVAVSGLRGYQDARGIWALGLVPEGGPSDSVATPNCLENAARCDEIVSGFTWHHQHALICEVSDLMVCVGLSCGTIAEIAWTKWVKGPRILALRDTISDIPKEILADIDIEFVRSLEELEIAAARILKGSKMVAETA